jgi:hypothetical protein
VKGGGEWGDWETGRLGDWETGRLGDWETGRLGDWETGRLGDWEKYDDFSIHYPLSTIHYPRSPLSEKPLQILLVSTSIQTLCAIFISCGNHFLEISDSFGNCGVTTQEGWSRITRS